MTQIKINGKDYNIAYNMRVAIAFERETGSAALDIAHFSSENGVEAIMTLGRVMVNCCNKDAKLTEEEWLESFATAQEVTKTVKAISAEIVNFFTPDATDKEEKSEDEIPNV